MLRQRLPHNSHSVLLCSQHIVLPPAATITRGLHTIQLLLTLMKVVYWMMMRTAASSAICQARVAILSSRFCHNFVLFIRFTGFLYLGCVLSFFFCAFSQNLSLMIPGITYSP
ncbi:hypothetical protein ANCCAN_17621 [Ancylostoma caninum]|uniref:Uncharacterized protein n=1 Tax=Ancylostoma caninum TaxID=29170 RepID=A0A368FWC0_ANCCA|nr:hypothetical protein ANCCAN_17621 [Ancylostoma caninum]